MDARSFSRKLGGDGQPRLRLRLTRVFLASAGFANLLFPSAEQRDGEPP